MTEQNLQPHTPQRRARLNWAIIVGLGALGLLWPITGVFGLDGPWRALAVGAVTILTWIGVVGFGRVPRPILTLTLAGVAYGVLYVVAIAIIVTPLALFSGYMIGITAGLGALCGLAAAGIQKALAR